MPLVVTLSLATACGNDDAHSTPVGETTTTTSDSTSSTSTTSPVVTEGTDASVDGSTTDGGDSTGEEVVKPASFEMYFTRPEPDQPDLSLEDVVIDLLESTPAGGSVRAAYYTFTRTRMAEAFVEAHERGVDVRLILGNTNNPRSSAMVTLGEGLGNRLTICSEGQDLGGCIGDRINHNKFILFSELEDGSRGVVLQSSANFTTAQTNNFNNIVVIREDTALYEAYADYWYDLHAQVTDLDYHHSVVGDLNTEVSFYPRASGDTIVEVLDDVNCASGAEVYIGMAFFNNSRIAVAERLVDMDAQGCNVRVVTREGSNSGDVLVTLSTGTIDLSIHPRMHSKYLLVDGVYGEDGPHQKLVWTGSHNYTGAALRRNDETLLEIRQDEVFEAYLEDWEHARSDAETLHP